MRLAFLFMVVNPDGSKTYKVNISKHHDYVDGRTGWMDNPEFPPFNDKTGTLRPDVDITDEVHKFESEEAAIYFMAKHYEQETRIAKAKKFSIPEDKFAQIRLIVESLRMTRRPRRYDLKSIFAAIIYRLETDTSWTKLPPDFPHWSAVRDYFVQWSMTVHYASKRSVLEHSLILLGREDLVPMLHDQLSGKMSYAERRRRQVIVGLRPA